MKQENHGLVLIVNFENFKHDEDKRRKGSQYDVKKLSSLFCELGFKTIVKQDLNIRQFHSELILFSEDNRHKNAEMSVIIVMSHGKEGFIQCSDNLWVRKS